MDARFLEMARAATAGSSQIRSLPELPDQTRVRKYSGIDKTEMEPVVRLQLIEDDGFLDWEEVTGTPPDLGQFRGASATKSSAEFEAMEFEFKRLPPSKITEFLSRRDDGLTPHRGLRRLNLAAKKLEPAEFPGNGPVLLLVHGTFSNSENMIAGFFSDENPDGLAFLERAERHYRGNLFTFDHPTLSVGPILNAIDLQRAVSGSEAQIDLVSHSRGGLVSRWWCETFDPNGLRCDRAIFVGAPLAGTGLAAPPNIRETIHLLTQVSRALQVGAGLTSLAIPVFSVVEAMLRVVTSITSLASKTPVVDAAMAMVPGLFAMSRVGNNPELTRLLATPSPNTERYFAIQSDFQPTDPAWKFWRMFRKDRLLDAATDLLFDGANDLVVDTPSMNDLASGGEIPDSRIHDFGASETVHHLNYFYQADTANFLAETLFSR